ncbi:beta-ketoacyl-ACP synthase II [Bacteroidetes bacterium endosymbiont of Geopemphigus sp.]|uniref:beta-ketoacyl-ACP synthase II n=1 Tax=Bacteroidetes bacterium endosymbiont of Geopemphigus sp. TaxID=2047937 RepID=UPI000CD02E51|nr:beta-ketoacyl-ACP synthase II [Bacteroidetes bacterium endosymbiont of Geopemphigus sp.]
MQLKKVVVTGLGALTPIGVGVDAYWQSLIQGVSGSSLITYFDTEAFKTKFACELKAYKPEDFFDKKEKRKFDPCAQFGIISADEALCDSGLNLSEEDKDRIGVIWGSGIGGILTFEQEVSFHALGDGIPRFNPFFIPKMIVDTTAGLISIKHELRGPNYSTVSACASAANALVDAYHLIQLGKAEVILAGGSEAAITKSGIGGFNALHALSTRNEDFKTASRPFDKGRDGFVLGEGAACLVLEEYEHAKTRGAKIYGQFAGVGLSADAYHMTAPHPKGLGIVSVMQNALKDAQLKITDIDHINTHGTSTSLGDIAEIKAIKKLFGEHTSKININSTKSMTGHLLGAAGAIEAIASLLPLTYNKIPPTINNFELDEKIKEIDPKINLTVNTAQKRIVKVSMCNIFGFGGHNVCLLFKKI